jgi:hypothetical protein
MTTIRRTPLADAPHSAAWVSDPWGGHPAAGFADQVHEADRPTHSPVLGPDGRPLRYEARPRLGFDLTLRGGAQRAKDVGGRT